MRVVDIVVAIGQLTLLGVAQTPVNDRSDVKDCGRSTFQSWEHTSKEGVYHCIDVETETCVSYDANALLSLLPSYTFISI